MDDQNKIKGSRCQFVVKQVIKGGYKGTIKQLRGVIIIYKPAIYIWLEY